MAGVSGNNGFSSLYLTALQQAWDKLKENEEDILKKVNDPANVTEANVAVSPTKLLIEKLKILPKPTEFWLALMRSVPKGATATQMEAHRIFCRTACDICAVVGHTAGVERAGKGYGLVLTSLRKAMSTDRMKKAVYVLENYGLRDKDEGSGDAYLNFSVGLLDDDGDASYAQHQLRRGSLLLDDAGDVHSDDDNSDDEDDDGLEAPEKVDWYVPLGFKVMSAPNSIDNDCIGRHVFMNWKQHGWQLGQVTALITSATPRLFKKYNVRVTWLDGNGPAKLDLNMYAPGPDAVEDAWVFLKAVD